MDKLQHYILPENTNSLYEKEAISSIGLTRDVADKINELVDAYNELSKMDLEWKQTQEGTIRKGIIYMKDNLVNAIYDLLQTVTFYNIMNEDTQALIIKRSEDLQKQINALASGAPIPVPSVDKMTDKSKIYVNTTNGIWYYHNGEVWESVGVYQATQIEDNSITSSKRTVVGDYGYLFSEKGDITIDVDNLALSLTGTHMLIYRNRIITVEATTLEIPSNEPYMLYFDINERDFRWHRPSDNIHQASENCVYLGYVAVADGAYTHLHAPSYTVVRGGKTAKYSNGAKIKPYHTADLLSGSVEIDTVNNTINFKSAVYSLGTNYVTITKSIAYDEVSDVRIKYVTYNTKTGDVTVYENKNTENADEILLFAFYQNKLYHSYVNRHLYTINGVASGNENGKLYGKKAVFFGDSITRGAGSSTPFTGYLAEETSLTVTNEGVDGYKSIDVYNTINSKAGELKNYDIIGVMVGTNDYWQNLGLGEFKIEDITSTTYSTTLYYDRIMSIAKKLIANAPDKFIFLMTPINGYRSADRIAEGYASFPYPTNSKNFTLDDYCEIVRKVGKALSIPVLDMKNISGLCPMIKENDVAFYYDGVHLNSKGYEKMAKTIANFLNENYR